MTVRRAQEKEKQKEMMLILYFHRRAAAAGAACLPACLPLISAKNALQADARRADADKSPGPSARCWPGLLLVGRAKSVRS